jgi:hypothetical protein
VEYSGLFSAIDFHLEIPGPKNISENLKSPIESVSFQIITLRNGEMLKKMKYPEKNKFKPKPKWLAKWKDMAIEDLKRFIAIQYLMSFIRLPQIKSYWDKSKYFSVFGEFLF